MVPKYLKLRTQSTIIHDSMSDDYHLQFGVSQDSVLDPLVFVLCTKPIGIIATKYGVQYHLYQYHLSADNTQLYVSLCMTQILFVTEKPKTLY